MAVIVVGRAADALEAALRQVGCRDIRATASADATLAEYRQRPASVLLVDANEPHVIDPRFLTDLRRETARHHRYTAVLVRYSDPAQLAPEILESVDDLLSATAPEAELRCRLAMATRLGALQSRAGEDGTDNAGASMTDPLTGLGNDRYLRDHLSALLFETEARGGISYCGMIELEHYPTLVARYGEPVTHEVLQGIASRLRKMLRPLDFIARLNSDHFAVAVRHADSSAKRPWIFERLLRGINHSPIPTTAGEIPITTSIGLCHHAGETGTNADALLACARSKVDQAKQLGGNILVD